MPHAATVKQNSNTVDQAADVKSAAEKAALQRKENEPEKITEARTDQYGLDAFHSGNGGSLAKVSPFQARMRRLNIPLDGTPVSINKVVQRVEINGQHPVQRKEDFAYLQRTLGNRAVVQLLDKMQNAGTQAQERQAAFPTAKETVQTRPLNHSTPFAITPSAMSVTTTTQTDLNVQAQRLDDEVHDEVRTEDVSTPVQKIATASGEDVEGNEDNGTSRNNSASVQRLSHSSIAQTSAIHHTAAAGVQGTGSQLPHLDKIQQSFGQHDVSSVQAFTGTKAAAASKTIGAEAYTTGNKIAFNRANPGLHTTAHEAAHVIQQQAGVQLQGGVGEVGDRYERHADAVAERVVKGQSAEGLLSRQTSVHHSEALQREQQEDDSGLCIKSIFGGEVMFTSLSEAELNNIAVINEDDNAGLVQPPVSGVWYDCDGFWYSSRDTWFKIPDHCRVEVTASPALGSGFYRQCCNIAADLFKDGPHWSSDGLDSTKSNPFSLAEEPEAAAAPNDLVNFAGTNFVGNEVRCDTQFVSALQRVDGYAGTRLVQVYVTSSVRALSQVVNNAVVVPATASNHHAGHAIDMNLIDTQGFYNSTALHPTNLTNLPQGVQNFIADIRADAELRWGGDFSDIDPVHIDDGLNLNDLAGFQERIVAVQDEI